MTSFAKNLKEIRLKKGISLRQLADATGKNINIVKAWESAKSKPKFDALKKICVFLDVRCDELLEL